MTITQFFTKHTISWISDCFWKLIVAQSAETFYYVYCTTKSLPVTSIKANYCALYWTKWFQFTRLYNILQFIFVFLFQFMNWFLKCFLFWFPDQKLWRSETEGDEGCFKRYFDLKAVKYQKTRKNAHFKASKLVLFTRCCQGDYIKQDEKRGT